MPGEDAGKGKPAWGAEWAKAKGTATTGSTQLRHFLPSKAAAPPHMQTTKLAFGWPP